MSWWAAAAAAAGALLDSNRQNAAVGDANNAADLAYQRQAEFAQNGIQWRVADAKAAGLHPLFALGGNTASFTPATPHFEGGQGDYARAVQNFSEIYYKQAALETAAASAEKDQAIAAYYNALAAKESQRDNSQPPQPSMFDATRVEPAVSQSRHSQWPAVSAGSAPFWRTFQLRGKGVDAYSGESWREQNDLMIDLPFSEEGPSESLQDLPTWMYPEVIRHNSKRYGGDWIIKFLEAYPDSPIGAWLRGESRRYDREFSGEAAF